MPDDGWGVDISTFSDEPITFDPAVCADVELASQVARTFDDEHRKVDEAARFSTPQSRGGLITATYVDSFDAPFPTSILDAAGGARHGLRHVHWTKSGSTSTRHVKAISVPPLGDRSFGGAPVVRRHRLLHRPALRAQRAQPHHRHDPQQGGHLRR
ncbi:hypothetical protein LP422_01565 [Janibacter limosus]|uniref:Uncharacterized protein n=1 Tax=Janibacter limosus TaxID=53458 RepID=A0AC61U4Z3_9MICO|nr:hypothetical protein [Janibacter limosus]UUZ45060.1 hypothetical protein LP422_01565 [Janibacter limosus]